MPKPAPQLEYTGISGGGGGGGGGGMFSIFSPAAQYLVNTGFGQSKEPSPWGIEPCDGGRIVGGCKVRLRAADGRYLRSDGREGHAPAWDNKPSKATEWLLHFDGDFNDNTRVQIESPTSGGGGGEPCMCNDTPTGGWGGAVKGKYSYCPKNRGDAYWNLKAFGDGGGGGGGGAAAAEGNGVIHLKPGARIASYAAAEAFARERGTDIHVKHVFPL